MRPADLARRIGVKSSTVKRYEDGEQLPTGVILVALSDVLQVAPKVLLGSDAKVLPEVVARPRVGRPPGPKDAFAEGMLAELRSGKSSPPIVAAPLSAPVRRTKHGPE